MPTLASLPMSPTPARPSTSPTTLLLPTNLPLLTSLPLPTSLLPSIMPKTSVV
ncbi:Hypothetical protein FKW44_000384 [Caligus rogercresseyi]|uniref:Uncharacterized protein n=1 Tax=Caligus rogercresseyi TaxID=217165 RepID=A0A7T8QUV9_CALRO|nr:Hypothetical protein FKW44_000384 [Caligus rogercresseyi]